MIWIPWWVAGSSFRLDPVQPCLLFKEVCRGATAAVAATTATKSLLLRLPLFPLPIQIYSVLGRKLLRSRKRNSQTCRTRACSVETFL